MNKLIQLALLAIVLVGGTVATMLFMTGGFSHNASAQAWKTGDTPPAEAEPPTYINLGPAFTVAVGTSNPERYLQVKLSLATRDPSVQKTIDANMPAIRNDLVMLFSSQNPDDLKTREGKEKLRAEALKDIQKVVKKYTGRTGVDEVLFTSFLMQ